MAWGRSSGQINPAIFQPSWLASIGILEAAEAADATPPIVSPELTVGLENLMVQVTHERVLVRGRSETYTADGLRDLVARLFTELRHTPISSLDMVHDAHLEAGRAGWYFAAHFADEALASRILPGGYWSEPS